MKVLSFLIRQNDGNKHPETTGCLQKVQHLEYGCPNVSDIWQPWWNKQPQTSASGLLVAEQDGGLGDMKVSRDFWLFSSQMPSEQLLWRRSVECMKQRMRIFTVCHFCKFVCTLQRNKLGWNFKFITCTRPLFFQCFHCKCIVENCGMFLEKKVINLIVAFWKLLWKFSLYSQYLYILSPSLSVSLFSWTMPPDLGLVHPEPST